MNTRWAGWTCAAVLVLALGWVANWHVVIAAGLLASIVCGSRWITIARAQHEADREAGNTTQQAEKAEAEAEAEAEAQTEAAPPTNIIRFPGSKQPPSGG